MWVYLVILLIPLLRAFKPPRQRQRHLGLLVYFVVLWLFTGLRHEIGPDWLAYTYIYEGQVAGAWSEVLSSREPGFSLLNKLSEAAGWGVYGVNAICAAIFLGGVYRFATRTANPWLATAAVVPFLVFIISMSGIRQAAAIGIVFSLLADWHTIGIFRKMVFILLAATLHNSALFMLVFVLWDGSRYPWLRIMVGSLAILFSMRILDQAGAVDVYAQRYLETNVESAGAVYHIALSALPAAIFLVFRRQLAAHGWDSALMMRASVLSLAMLPLVLVSSTGASRLALYLSFVQMWVFPAFVASHGRRWVVPTACCAVYFLAIFFVYFTLGSHASAYLPYGNILWIL